MYVCVLCMYVCIHVCMYAFMHKIPCYVIFFRPVITLYLLDTHTQTHKHTHYSYRTMWVSGMDRMTPQSGVIQNQEMPCLSQNPKVYHVYKSPPLVPILSQMLPVHTFPPYFSKIHSNIKVLSTPGSSKWSIPSGFLVKIMYIFLISPNHSACPSHLIIIGFMTLILFDEV
jgi:hypothetical protein